MTTRLTRDHAWVWAWLLAPGCLGPWQASWEPEGDSGSDTDVVLSDTAPEIPEIQGVAGEITTSTTWTADRAWRLDGVVHVVDGATLTIEPGTTILGAEGSALIVTVGSTLRAQGEPTAPITFTSAKAPGSRARGDWGGVVLLGDAPLNVESGQIEGIDASDPRGRYGGDRPDGSCGVLEFVRVQFAGFEAYQDNELNGLTLGGCGGGTIVRNVHVHLGLDDGIEAFGGNVDLRNIVVSGAGDDSLDWDQGWTGRVQFLIVQQHADDGDNAFEADSNLDIPPRSRPTIYNATLVGSREPAMAQRAALLREGTGGLLRNFVITGFPTEALDIRDAETVAAASDGQLELSHALLYDIGPDGITWTTHPAEVGEEDDDVGFDEGAWLLAQPGNVFDENPLLPAAAFDAQDPDFVPLPSSPAVDGALVPPQDEFWDRSADFLGAVRPGEASPFYLGWTDFPAD